MSYPHGRLKRFYDASPVPLQNILTTLYGTSLAGRVHGRAYRHHFAELERSQWLPAAEHERVQLERLRRLIAFAAAHSDYWASALATHGMRARELRSVDELRRLQPLERETVHAHAHALLTRPARDGRMRTVAVHTSGTTGTALRVVLAWDAFVREHAFRWLHRSWAGVRRGERTATIAGHPVVPVAAQRPPFWRYNAAERQLIFSAQHIAADTLPHYAERLRRFRPVLLHGYPSALQLVAAHLVETGEAGVRPRAVFTHSETLLDHQRELLQRAFGCTVFNWYGTSEHAGNIVSCERGSLHVKLEHSVIELVRADGTPADAGEEAEIWATPLHSYAMPLLRYRTGDVAVPRAGECACGRAGPLVERVLGRTEDFIVTPEGRRVGRLDHAFKHARNVAEAQLVQHAVDTLDVHVVPRADFGAADAAALEEALRQRLGAQIIIRIHCTDRIPRSPTGKVRFAVSHVPGAAIQTAG